nr:ATP-binding cassette domain-containing protein [Paenibacillus caui]
MNKQFKTPVVREGRFAGLRTLFARDYRVKEAVRDISFEVESGEFVGYIGPNGAGKSTTIKMLTGILHPTGGEVLLGGINPHRERRRAVKRLGVVFGQRSQLWWDLPVKDSFDILARMYRVEESVKRKRLDQFAELLNLQEFWQTPVRKLSLGQRMRADLAAAMLHDPDLLFLDEPTIGLDVNAKRGIRGFLKLLNEEFGKTILLTTHDMDDIEQLCRRVMVIGDGELSYDGTPQSLRDAIGLPTRFHVTYRGNCNIPDGTMYRSCSGSIAEGEAGNAGIKGNTTVTGTRSAVAPVAAPLVVTSRQGNMITVEANRQEMKTMDVLRMLAEWGEIEDVDMEEPDFEEVIHRVY